MKHLVLPPRLKRSAAVVIADSTQVGIARRQSALLCEAVGMSQTDIERARIVVTEAGKNIFKHGQSGQIVLRILEAPKAAGLEILALDKGAGMQDLSRCMQDGFSTAGSPGTGMGAMLRLSDVFDVFTLPGKGTALLGQVWSRNASQVGDAMEVGCVCVPKSHGDECGDWWSVRHERDLTQVLLVDGLGHGAFAAKAADEAVRIFQGSDFLAPSELILMMHAALRPTRGASVAIAQIDHRENIVHYAGVGNISGCVIKGGKPKGMVSHNGTVGHELHKVKDFEYSWSHDSFLAMHSDGISSRWDLESYPGLVTRHPALIAGVLYRDYRREHDDCTMLVAMHPGSFSSQAGKV